MTFFHRPTEPLSFELLAGTRTAHGYPLTVIQSPAGEASGLCRLDPADVELQDALGAIFSRTVDRKFMADVGSLLFDELFTQEVGALFASSLSIARAQSAQLTIRLRFEA